jgi:hypothetical protein
MIDGAVVPLPEGYHAFSGRATGWFRIRRGATVGVAGREGFAGRDRRSHGGDGDRQMGRRGPRSDAAVRTKYLILLTGDKVTAVALPDSLIYTYICDSHPNNISYFI